MNFKNHEWIGEVLADIEQFCDMNGLSATSVELARAKAVLSAEQGAQTVENSKDRGSIFRASERVQ